MIAFVVGLCVLSVVLACLGYEWAGMAIAGIGFVVVLAMAKSGWADGKHEDRPDPLLTGYYFLDRPPNGKHGGNSGTST